MARARGFGILWIICLLVSLTITGSPLFAELLAVSAAFLVVSVSAGIFGGRHVEMELKMAEMSEKNTRFRGRLRIVNKGLLPVFYGICELNWENTLTLENGKMLLPFAVSGKGAAEVAFEGSSSFCGNSRFWIEQWKIYDLLRLFKGKRKGAAMAELLILPEAAKIHTELLTREVYDMESFRYSGTRRGDDPGETFDIRAYRQGDSMKQIHWKLTGKLDQVVVKEMSYPVYDSVLLIPELFCEGEKTAEKRNALAEMIASAALSLTMEGKAFEFCFCDSRQDQFYMERIETEEEFWELFSLFLKAAGKEKAPAAVEKYLENRGGRRFAHYLYFTAEEAGKPEEQLRESGAVTVFRCAEQFSESEGEICFSAENWREQMASPEGV